MCCHHLFSLQHCQFLHLSLVLVSQLSLSRTWLITKKIGFSPYIKFIPPHTTEGLELIHISLQPWKLNYQSPETKFNLIFTYKGICIKKFWSIVFSTYHITFWIMEKLTILFKESAKPTRIIQRYTAEVKLYKQSEFGERGKEEELVRPWTTQ